jgi:hypothetical protein
MTVHILGELSIGRIFILLVAGALVLGGVGLVLYSARMTREAVSKRLDLIHVSRDAVAHMVPMASSLIRSGLKGSEERERRAIARIMLRFGVPERRAGAVLTSARLLMGVLFALLGYIVILHWLSKSGTQTVPLMVAAFCGIVGSFVPITIIRRAVKTRTKAVVEGLPDALEILVICVEAVLSF